MRVPRLAAFPAALLLVLLAADSAPAAVPDSCGGQPIAPTKTITGEFGQEQQGSYVFLPFDVPAGTTQVRVKYCWDQPENKGSASNTIDLGVYSPRVKGDRIWGENEFRGWGGSSHPDTAISAQGPSPEASYLADPKGYVPGATTRGYEPGKIEAGQWAVELGVAAVTSVDQGNTDGKVAWRVEIELSSDPAFAKTPYKPTPYDSKPAKTKAGWYGGDMHVHAENSNLGAATMTQVFDYAFKSLSAGGAGLDYITLTDYVGDVQWGEIGKYQPKYKGKMISRGAEVITYKGHTNNQASAKFVDYRTGPLLLRADDGTLTQLRRARNPKEIFKEVRDAGGYTQINHPTIFPSSTPGFAQLCRGCPWDYTSSQTDFKLVNAIEVATSLSSVRAADGTLGPGPFTQSAIDFYEKALAAGNRIAAVAASDAHNAGEVENASQTPLGTPSTEVYAPELSEKGVEAGVQARHTYAKLFGAAGADLRLDAKASDGTSAIMGGALAAKSATFTAQVLNASSSPDKRTLLVLKNGKPLKSFPITKKDTKVTVKSSGAGRYGLELMRGDAIEAYSTPIWLGSKPDPGPATTLTASSSLKASGGAFSVKCAVDGLGSKKCTVTAKAGGKVIGTGSASPKTSPATVKVKLNSSGKSMLSAAGSKGLAIALTAEGTGFAGTTTTKPKSAKLK